MTVYRIAYADRMMLRVMMMVLGLSLPVAAQVQGIEHARMADVQVLQGTVFHVQGIDLDKEHIWVTSVDSNTHIGYLHQFNRKTGVFERQVDVTDGERYHPGGFSISGDSIWVPVAEYKPNSSATLLELDKKTLKVKRKISVADHIGCVAVTKDSLIAGNWGSRKLYVLGMDGKVIRVIDTPSQNQYQDIKFVNGMLVGGGNLTKTTGALDWYEWPSMKPVRSLASGTTDRGRLYSAEGMTLKGNDLYLLPEDGPTRVFHFVIDK
ncbi:DUF6454 family protein [Terriglobus sp. ADX1]|uniref:DUF6454 family protein n=1 Tax=Terriglobus sp. ADX1 TaxID=2794063 RepID=UPI002FE694CF